MSTWYEVVGVDRARFEKKAKRRLRKYLKRFAKVSSKVMGVYDELLSWGNEYEGVLSLLFDADLKVAGAVALLDKAVQKLGGVHE